MSEELAQPRFLILGPLAVLGDGLPVELPAGRPRALLALLLVNVNEVVPTGRMLEELWRGRPPPTARHAVQVHILKLRKILEGGRAPGDSSMIVTRPGGYLLVAPPDQIDARRFEALVGQGGRALDGGAPAEATVLLGEALTLWRGPLLADLGEERYVRGEAARLDELRSVATERWVEAELALGHHTELIGPLERLVGEHPFRERLWSQLIVALYRAGRSAEALHAYQRLRKSLAEELGLDPSPQLRRLEAAVLRHDPNLALPAPLGQSNSRAPTWSPSSPCRIASSLSMRCRSSDGPLNRRCFRTLGRRQPRAAAGPRLWPASPASARPGWPRSSPPTRETRAGWCCSERATRSLRSPTGRSWTHCDKPSTCPETEVVRAVGERGTQLSRLVPEVRRFGSDTGGAPGSDPETERYLLFNSVVEFLAGVAEWRPVLLFLDDLHWATKPTLLLLRHLIRAAPPGLFIVAVSAR